MSQNIMNIVVDRVVFFFFFLSVFLLLVYILRSSTKKLCLALCFLRFTQVYPSMSLCNENDSGFIKKINYNTERLSS